MPNRCLASPRTLRILALADGLDPDLRAAGGKLRPARSGNLESGLSGRGKRKSTEFVTWGQVGGWFERYARKIDNLPILNVDPEMLDYGVFVADSLRQSETVMKGIGAKSGMRKT